MSGITNALKKIYEILKGIKTAIEGIGTADVLELATNAETLAGTDTARAVTPDDMAYVGMLTGWVPVTDTWTYSSVDDPTGIITVPSDATTKYSAGMRISFVNGGNTIYGIITAVTATTITFLHEIDPTDSEALHLMANSANTVPKYSTQKAPFGFPLEKNKWTVLVTSTSNNDQSSATTATYYNLGSLSISVPIGAWNLSSSGSCMARMTANVSGFTLHSALSTVNNTASDNELVSHKYFQSQNADIQILTNSFNLSKYLEVSSKTTYYLNQKYTATGTNSYIRTTGTNQTTVIKLVSTYL